MTLHRLSVLFMVTAGPISCAFSQETPATQMPDTRGAAVFRYSWLLFERIVAPKIERDVPVRVWVLDAWVVGQAHVKGTVSVDFDRLKFGEPLPIQFDGEILARVNAYRKPLVVDALSRIPFQTALRVSFDGGKFHVAQGSAKAQCKSAIHGIRKQRCGLGSRLVTRLGWRIIPRRLPQYDAEASRLVETYILNSVSKMLAPALAQAR